MPFLQHTLVRRYTWPNLTELDTRLQLPAGVILSIVTFPGKSTGENVSAVFTALLGVALGAANFAILSKLHSSLVAQAIVFAIMVYGIAILKASDPR